MGADSSEDNVVLQGSVMAAVCVITYACCRHRYRKIQVENEAIQNKTQFFFVRPPNSTNSTPTLHLTSTVISWILVFNSLGGGVSLYPAGIWVGKVPERF